jgi:hypothetical protein
MKESFGSNARFKIRGSGSYRLIYLDVKASRETQARWVTGTWKRILKYANGTFYKEEDVGNILGLMRDLGWSPPAESISGSERRACASKMIKEHFLDSISRFVCDSLQPMSENLARLPDPSPIRICAAQQCSRFFVRDGKHSYCEKHRGVKGSRSTDENRRYKFIRDNLRTPIHKLEKKISSGRLESARDGVWKDKCVTQIHTDRTKGIKKRPTDYLRIG